MAKIVTFGELMLRFSIENERIETARCFDVCYGGGEANVAVSLSHFGHDAYFVSRFPSNSIGLGALKELKKEGIKTDYIKMGGDRLGTYYLETGSSLRASKVIYDRSNSAFATSSLEDYNFEDILKEASIFHFTGITPALSEKCAILVEKACKTAKKLGILISCDLNYRKKLWTKEQARKVMIPLMKYVDVCIGNEEDFESCLGYKPDADVSKGKTDAKGYMSIFKQAMNDFGFKIVASSLRESFSASHNGWKGLMYDGKEFFESKHYDIQPIVDRVGSGDSFAAGLIHGLLCFNDKQKAIEFAVAASALKHTIKGDFNQVTEEEVINLMNGDSSGRVVR